MNILSCVREASARKVKIDNCNRFFEGMPIAAFRGFDQRLGDTEVLFVHPKQGQLVLKQDLGIKPGDLLMASYDNDVRLYEVPAF